MDHPFLSTRALWYGFLVWLFPFIGAFPIFPLKEKYPLVFKALMGVILAAAAAGASRYYFASTPIARGTDGLWLGCLWAALSIAIDIPLFVFGFKMKLAVYLSEIGLAYLAVPAIAWGNAGLLVEALGKR